MLNLDTPTERCSDGRNRSHIFKLKAVFLLLDGYDGETGRFQKRNVSLGRGV